MANFVVVCGPPCAGKSTYVRENAQAGDTVIDWDDIVVDLGFPARHHFVDRSLVPIIMDEWRRRLDAARHSTGTVWVLRSKPARESRALAVSLGAELVEISAPIGLLLARAKERPHPVEHERLILAWHANRRRKR